MIEVVIVYTDLRSEGFLGDFWHCHYTDYTFAWHKNSPSSAQDGAICKAVKF